MHPLSETILANYQIRKTQRQKTAFIDFLRGQIPDLQVEAGGLLHNRNLVVGDVRTAKVIFLFALYKKTANRIYQTFGS